MMRAPLPSWTRMLLLWISIFAGTFCLVALESRQAGRNGPGRPSTYSSGPQGYKALFLWFKNIGIPVERLEHPITGDTREVATLMILQPEYGPNPGELDRIEQWVRRGGTLILSSVPAGPYMARFGIQGEFSHPGDPGPGKARRLMPHPGPYVPEEYTLFRMGAYGLTASAPEVVFHATDSSGGFVAVAKAGRGRVIAVADPLLFNNQSLRQGDHARFILNLISDRSGRGAVGFDEYHHGYGRATSVLHHVARSAISSPLLQGMVLVLFLWAARGRRFGAARPVREGGSRFSMEYVKALAQLFSRGKKREFALEAILRWVEEESRRFVLQGDGNLQKTLGEARQYLRTADKDDGLLRRCNDLVQALNQAKQPAKENLISN